MSLPVILLRVKITIRFAFPFALLSFMFLSCNNSNQKTDILTQNFLDSLVEKQVGQLSYYISIPAKYNLTEKEGPDFSVFYFADSDTTAMTGFSGGMYFGNHPSEFPPGNDLCNVRTIESPILGSNSSWTIYECDGEFAVQTIVDSKSGKGWNSQIHVFGHGKSKEDLDKILAIYSTLRKKT